MQIRYRVALDVTIDTETEDPPSDWTWSAGCTLDRGHDVEFINEVVISPIETKIISTEGGDAYLLSRGGELVYATADPNSAAARRNQLDRDLESRLRVWR